MDKGKAALTGAASGAAAGAALGPYGAAAGAVVGGVAGYMGAEDGEAPSYTPDERNFKFGLGNARGFASQEAGRIATERNHVLADANSAQNRTAPKQMMPDSISQVKSGGQAFLHGADTDGRREQLQALGGMRDANGALRSFAGQAEGPSAAQAQLQAGTDMAAKQQFGFARAQPGGGGAALRDAAMNAAGISGNSANQAAMLRAQESQSFRNQQLQALGAVQQGAGQITGAASGLRGQDQGFAQTQAGQSNYDAGAANQFNQGQQQLQFSVGQNNLNSGLQTNSANDAYQLGQEGVALSQDSQRFGLAAQNTAQGNALESARAQGAGLGSANFNAATAQGNAETGMALGAASGGAGAIAQLMKDKPPVAASGNVAPAAPPNPTSDVRAKKDISRVDMAAALGGHDLRPAQGYEYAYRDPEQHGAGHYVGPMAQDLEHLPGVVEQGHDGTKSINAPRLTLANTAAVSEQQRRLDEIEKRQQQFLALSGSMKPSGFARPDVQQPDYAAYERAAR